MGLCCLCYNFLPWEEMEGAGVGLLRGGAGSPAGAGECAGKGFISHCCSLRPQKLPLPLPPPQGITTYFSGDCTMEDAKLAQDFLDSQVWVTRGIDSLGPLATGPYSWASAWAQRHRHRHSPWSGEDSGSLSKCQSGWNEDSLPQAEGPLDSLREGEGRTSEPLGWAFTSQPSSPVTNQFPCL